MPAWPAAPRRSCAPAPSSERLPAAAGAGAACCRQGPVSACAPPNSARVESSRRCLGEVDRNNRKHNNKELGLTPRLPSHPTPLSMLCVLRPCRYGQLESVTSAVSDLLNKHEHTPAPLAELLRVSVVQWGDARLVRRLLLPARPFSASRWGGAPRAPGVPGAAGKGGGGGRHV
jgi:hypothetical protein